jgi:hypothetical protein
VLGVTKSIIVLGFAKIMAKIIIINFVNIYAMGLAGVKLYLRHQRIIRSVGDVDLDTKDITISNEQSKIDDFFS